MLQQQFIDLIKQPQSIESTQLSELEGIIQEYPFFETAHLLYTKGLHRHNALHYSRQLRKTAVIANSRTVLYELLHKKEGEFVQPIKEETPVHKTELILEQTPSEEVVEKEAQAITKPVQPINPVTVTNNELKVIYINTVSSAPVVPDPQQVVAKEIDIPVTPEPKEEVVAVSETTHEIDIVKDIENETEAPTIVFNEDKLNSDIQQEINRSIIQSYVETEIIKTPELYKDEPLTEPASFSEWLNRIKTESGAPRVEPKKEASDDSKIHTEPELPVKTSKKPSFFDQNKGIIDKIIESDPGRIKLTPSKFFTPVSDAKQSLLENEHLVTETLAKIYALQGNISKAIRAYEILSLKFPQKSVYFASLIEKLKTNK